MGILKRLFGSSVPAPPCVIHPDDADLVREKDLKWWNKRSLDSCRAIERQDNVVRLGAALKWESDGISDADVAIRVRLRFAWYYFSLEQRRDERLPLGEADAKLPYAIKGRVNSAVLRRVIKYEPDHATSFNALVRELIRAGRI